MGPILFDHGEPSSKDLVATSDSPTPRFETDGRPIWGERLRIYGGRRPRTIVTILVLWIAILSVNLGSISPGFSSTSPRLGSVDQHLGAQRGASSAIPPPTGPTVVHVTPAGISNTGVFSWVDAANQSCYPGTVPRFCFNESADPSLIRLANGDLAVGFDVSNSTTTNSCAPGGPSYVTWQVGFAYSTNGGNSFSQPHLINNATCPYNDAFQPNFVSDGDSVYGAFVEANVTNYDGTWGCAYPLACFFSRDAYTDAIGFVTITHNGTAYSPIQTITPPGTGFLGRPVIAAFGGSIYVVYTQMENLTSLSDFNFYSTYPNYALSLEFIDSTNGGATWSTPTALPGVNLTNMNTTMGAAIAVDPSNGTIGVSYATNVSCAAWCTPSMQYLFGYTLGSDIDLATSANNGSTWSLQTISAFASQRSYIGDYYADDEQPMLLAQPQTSLDWTSTGEILLGWTAAYNQSAAMGYTCAVAYSDPCYSNSGAWVASTPRLGGSWTIANLSSPIANAATSTSGGDFNIAVYAPSASTIFVSMTDFNESAGNGGSEDCAPYSAAGTTVGAPSYQQLALSTTNGGGSWSTFNVGDGYFVGDEVYTGAQSAVLSNATGALITAFSLPKYNVGTTLERFGSDTEVASVGAYSGPLVNVTVDETGLTPGIAWSATLYGTAIQSASAPSITGSSVEFVGAPRGATVSLGIASILVGGKEFIANVSSTLVPTSDITVNATFLEFIGLTLALNPPNPAALGGYNFYAPYVESENSGPGIQWTYYGDLNGSQGCPFPWFLPAGNYSLVETASNANPTASQIFVDQGNGYTPIGWWIGDGSGNYTGPGPNGTIDLNETGVTETGGWGGWTMNASEEFQAIGLPSTSTYRFQFNGTGYSSAATRSVSVSNLHSGFYAVSDVEATSSQAGWAYFGSPASGNPIPVPFPGPVDLDFTTLENLAAPAVTVSLEVTGIGSGTPWQLAINGTTYGSTGPSINVTLHPGTYPIAGSPAIAANDSVAYVPQLNTSSLTITSAGVYVIPYMLTYRVSASGTAGGSVQNGGTHWVAPGGIESFEAIPQTGSAFAGWLGVGLGSYTGKDLYANVTVSAGPIVETASFLPPVLDGYTLNFTESGIPAGTWWTVVVNGTGYSSNVTSLSITGVYSCHVSGSIGEYPIEVPYAYANASGTRYVPQAYSSPACGGGSVALTFSAQYFVSVVGSPGGTISVALNGAPEPDQFWGEARAAVSLSAQAGIGYSFAGWNGTGSGSYTGSSGVADIMLSGAVSESANFQPQRVTPPVRFAVRLHASSTLEPGVAWSASLNGTNYSSSEPWINVSGFLAGTYRLSVAVAVSADGQTQYVPVNVPGEVTISSSNVTQSVTFETKYWVAISAVGTGTVSPGSAYYLAGSQVTLSANAQGQDQFTGWSGTGVGAYDGQNASPTIQVNGPLTEVASFTARAPAASTSAPTNFLATPGAYAIFAVIGLVIGIVGGWFLVRMRRSRPPAPPSAPSKTEAGP
jgi:Divergent InlB B-repeat domain